MAASGARTGAAAFTEIFSEVAAACDGQTLVAAAVTPLLQTHPALRADAATQIAARPRVLALGKAAAPMLRGLCAAAGDAWGQGLVIAPAARAPAPAELPPGFELILGEHPHPGPGSARAGLAALHLVAGLAPGDPLIVLLSGGGSALACLPAAGLGLDDKRAAVAAVAAAAASIGELNTLRKHLSAIKGGQLGRLARGPVLVLALSDVVGDDPGTIASGPFSPDPTTYADALAVLAARSSVATSPALAPVAAHLTAGRHGTRPETPKPGAGWEHVDYRVIAGPDHVIAAAERSIAGRGLRPVPLLRNTTADVGALADIYLQHVGQLVADGTADDAAVFIANGEPSIDLSRLAPGRAPGKGGRATHLALLVARGLARLAANAPDLKARFLAAGTDDRDGSGDASGALVDETSWNRALAAGLDPQAALDRFDSATLLDACGCLVRGPGTSNLLDLHLLAAGRR